MGRIRTVKPELFRHEALFEAETFYQLPLRLAFIGLFTCCDREGRFRWRPRTLKLDVLPYDEVDFSRVLDALAARGFIVKYEVGGEVFGCLPSWARHQYVNNKENDSGLPAPEEGDALAVRSLPIGNATTPIECAQLAEIINKNHGPATREARAIDAPITGGQENAERLFPAQGEREGERIIGKGKEEEKEEKEEREKPGGKKGFVAPVARPVVDKAAISLVFSYWQKTMQHAQAKLDSKRYALIRKALQAGYTAEQLCQAITGCALTPHNCGDNDRNQRYDGLHVILRDADQIDRFIHNANNPPRPRHASTELMHNNIQALQQWLKRQRPDDLPARTLALPGEHDAQD